ncbi:hypothetical protein UFOVP587_34 [uncultured Caudovirales phage]|uniref:Uncharacterized protein n=1 Tax=uncultured Caudovirales phage TaxID=2100421 RepID=A0A6J5MWX3_9CAUD|nr:hypothetical protein UFOVP587_34 [uncultured Caudovirales phage]
MKNRDLSVSLSLELLLTAVLWCFVLEFTEPNTWNNPIHSVLALIMLAPVVYAWTTLGKWCLEDFRKSPTIKNLRNQYWLWLRKP